MELLQKIWQNSKWHLLAAGFTMLFMGLIYNYNFMYLQNAKFSGIANSQYILQIFLCGFGSLSVGGLVEWYQGIKGANKTEEELKGSDFDIIVTTISGICGGLFYLAVFV